MTKLTDVLFNSAFTEKMSHPGVYSDRNILSRGIVKILKTDGDRNCVLSPVPLPATQL